MVLELIGNKMETQEKIAACTSHTDTEICGFWGEYRYLSNFHESPVVFNGVTYKSSENAYQAAKCADVKEAELFPDLTPSESRKLGRKIKIIDDWDRVKFNIMFGIVLAKFEQNPELQEKLLNTGHKYLEELNYWNDIYWGKSFGKGENNLGKILMTIRSLLRQGYI